MLNLRLSPISLVLAFSALTTSCWPKKPPKAFTPPPPQTQQQVPSNPPVVAGQPPQIAGDPASTIPQSPATIPEIAAPPAPKPPQQKKGSPVTAPVRPPATNTQPETTPPGPRLGPLYSADETRQYTRAIEDSLSRVRRALDSLSRKNLNADQQADVVRITNFQKQAEQARDAQDLLTAKALAERADTLAQDLLNRIP